MPQLQGLAHAYAISASATERMVAGEMLLALALQGEPVTDWWAQDAACTAFCNPYW